MARSGKPVIIINCKTYAEATGQRALKLAMLCEELAKKHNADIRVAVQPTDIALVARAVKIPVYAQHCDNATPGKSTGWVTAAALKAAGARGSLLNHSEHRISTELVKETTQQLKRAGLAVVVCAESIERLRELDKAVAADFFAVEPPELIGGDISVSVAQPTIIEGSVLATKRPLLIGAGVKEYRDLEIGQRLGAKGVLLASGVVLAKNQRSALVRLLKAR